jgi:lysozyme
MYDLDAGSPLREMLKRHEGLRTKVYACPAGFLTIGYGRNLEARGITREEADFLLTSDIRAFREEVRRALPWSADLDPVRRDVLVDMAFNLGVAGLLGFKQFLLALQASDYLAAAAHMLHSRWAEQVGARARELAEMIRAGRYAGAESAPPTPTRFQF